MIKLYLHSKQRWENRYRLVYLLPLYALTDEQKNRMLNIYDFIDRPHATIKYQGKRSAVAAFPLIKQHVHSHYQVFATGGFYYVNDDQLDLFDKEEPLPIFVC